MGGAGLFRKIIGSFFGIALVSVLIGSVIPFSVQSTKKGEDILNDYSSGNQENQELKEEFQPAKLYPVLSVTDGDTIRIDYNGTSTPVRLIGVDTPETVDQRTTVQCFGQEASNYLKATLTGKKVSLEADPTQSDRDKYDRLLRYVYLDDEDIGLRIIANGYGHEYTYNVPYQKQTEYKAAERTADAQNLGLWSPSTCNGNTTQPANPEPTPEPTPTPAPTPAPDTQTVECNIKGNINNKGEKIYHVPGQQYYNKTVITPSKGERYFCTEEEAVAAGWRKSKV
ncbi:thermonuclease family protein [Candidatus Saccharibacteria bacterium]|nr:thermonuclease family protein [Candidatus Saccharibacteria bacterium]